MTSNTNELRIAVVFRSDLDMPRGKAEVQFGHAVADLVADGFFSNRDVMIDYVTGTCLKLSMEVDDVNEIEAIARKAASRKVPYAIVTDAGRTVFGEPTVTCIGLGPMNKTDCNALTRNARMRK